MSATTLDSTIKHIITHDTYIMGNNLVTYRVQLFNLQKVYTSAQPDILQNIIYELQNATIQVQGVVSSNKIAKDNNFFKDGDCLTVPLLESAAIEQAYYPYLVKIDATIYISTGSIASGNVRTLYAQQIAATGGIGQLTFTALNLPSGLGITSSGMIFGYPTTSQSSSITVVVTDTVGNVETMSYPIVINEFVMYEVGSIVLPAGEQNDYSCTIDNTNGFAYFATYTSPAKVIKLRLSDFTIAGVLTIDTGGNGFFCSSIDVANGYLYCGSDTNPGKVFKVRLSDFTLVDSLTANVGEISFESSLIINGYLYCGTQFGNGTVVKIRLSDFTRVAGLVLNAGEYNLNSCTYSNGFLYFTCQVNPTIVVKIDEATFTRVASLTLNSGEDQALCTSPDGSGFIYLGTYTSPGIVVKVRLSDFTRVGSIVLNSGENNLDGCTLQGNFAYFQAYASPGIVIKIRLSDFTRISAITLGSGEVNLGSTCVIDNNNYFYCGTVFTNPGYIIKVQI